ncbi:MAG: hypothetical protein HY746_03430, partial [Elusimicrobia bacterium]|nr:hypothetical protein [Elusimicrobiota bacterium]
MTKTISTIILLFSLSGSIVSFAQDFDPFDVHQEHGTGTDGFELRESLVRAGIPLPAAVPDEDNKTGSEPKEWTIMAYINGNNDLEHRAIEKLRDMEDAGSTDKVNMVAELGKMKGYTWDGQKWRGSRRYYLVNDGSEYKFSSPVLQEFKEADMGDWEHLADFIYWAKKNYPAKKYMLIIFGHGSGWNSIDKPLTKGVLYDDLTNNHVTAVEMRKVFEKAGRVDVFFVDSCLMQDMAALYELRKHADIMIGSQDSIQANGVLYEYSLKEILENPVMTPEQAADAMVYPGPIQMGHAVFTMSAVRASKLEKLAGMLDVIAKILLSSGNSAYYRSTRDAAYSPDEDYGSQKDLGHFLKILSASAKDPAITEKAKEAFLFLTSEVVMLNYALYDEKEHGLAIYMPS